jgi:hypothetical protein
MVELYLHFPIRFPGVVLKFFFNSLVGGGVQMAPLGTSATEWPIVPAPGDYDD